MGAEFVSACLVSVVPVSRASSAPRAQKWVSTLRAAIKQQHGFGWSVRDKAGKVQLTHRFDDGTRSSVTLDCTWNPDATSEVLGLLPEIRSRMESRQLGLKEAYDLLRAPAARQEERLDWPLLVVRFQAFKVAHTGAVSSRTWESMYAPVMRQVLEAMAAKPVPRDARALLGALRDRCGGEPGSRGRKLRMQYACQLLRFGVGELGASERWLPPQDLGSFVGKPDVAPGFRSRVNESPHPARLGRGLHHETNPPHTRADHPQAQNR